MTSPEASDITVQSNLLLVNGESLTLQETSPDELSTVLEIGRSAIVGAIESFYHNQIDKHKDEYLQAPIKRPSVISLLLTNNARTERQKAEFLSPYGLTNSTGLYRHPIEITERTEPYWSAITASDFTPEIRQTAIRKGRTTISSLYLALRNPETDPAPVSSLEHLPAALGFRELGRDTLDYRALKAAYESGNDDEYYRLRANQLSEARDKINSDCEFYGEETRGVRHIGYLVARANLRLSIERDNYARSREYRGTLRAAADYARVIGHTGLSQIISDEHSRMTNN